MFWCYITDEYLIFIIIIIDVIIWLFVMVTGMWEQQLKEL